MWADLCLPCRSHHCIELKQRTHEVELGLLPLSTPLDGGDVVVERPGRPAEQEGLNVVWSCKISTCLMPFETFSTWQREGKYRQSPAGSAPLEHPA